MKKIRPINGQWWYLGQVMRDKRTRSKVFHIDGGRMMIFKRNANGECVLELIDSNEKKETL